MQLQLVVDHLALAPANCRHVDRDRTGHRAELRAVMRQMRDLRAPNLILRRHAGDVGTGTANPSALHDGSPSPRMRHLPGQELATRSTPENQDFKSFRLRHELPRIRRRIAAKNGALHGNANF